MPRSSRDRVAHGVFKAVSAAQILFDQMRDDFGIGFSNKLVVRLSQAFFQLQVVLDDAVVHYDHAAGAVAVRVSVLFGGPAVRGPTRVPDAVSAVERARAE